MKLRLPAEPRGAKTGRAERGGGRLVHELRLRRRRSHMPWLYLLYHQREGDPVRRSGEWVKGAGLFQE